MTFRHLECFVAVAEHLHFTKAAKQLKIAQPALSQQIKRLEEGLGVALFIRSNRRVELSEYGRALLPRAQQLLHQANVAAGEIREMAGLARGRLRIGASGTIAAFLLPEILAEYRRRHPNIIVEITQQRSEPILDLVEAGKLDIGLIRLPFRKTNLEITDVLTEPLYAALPAQHAAASHDVISLGGLRNDPFIMPVAATEPFYAVAVDLCAAAGFSPNIILAGAEYTTVFRLVGMGMGVSIVSRFATNLTVAPSPVFVRIDDPKAMTRIVTVANPAEMLSPATQAIAALIGAWNAQAGSGAQEPR